MSNDIWPVHNVADAVIASMKKWTRKPADRYETPYEATVALILADPPPQGTVREPACATGKISRVLIAFGYDVDSSDFRYTGYGEPDVDWLETREKVGSTFTNPPFKLAAAFIRRSIASGPYTAMLLKSNYFHTGSRLELYRQHQPKGIYPLTWRLPFLKEERGDSPLMDCTWFVWRNYGELRHEPLAKPKSFPAIPSAGMHVSLVHLGEAFDDLTQVYRGRNSV